MEVQCLPRAMDRSMARLWIDPRPGLGSGSIRGLGRGSIHKHHGLTGGWLGLLVGGLTGLIEV